MKSSRPLVVPFSLSLSFAALAQEPPPTPPAVVATYSIETLLPIEPPALPPMRSFVQVEMPTHEPIGLDPDTIIQLLNTLHGHAVESGSLALEYTGSMLLARGEPGATVAVGDSIATITAVVARPIEVSAWLVELPAGVEPMAEPDDATLEALQQHAMWHASAWTRSNMPVALSSERWTRFVYDVDSEVAEKSSIGDPKVWPLFEGIRLVLEPHALAGTDDLVLLCQGAVGSRRSLQQRSTGVPKQPALDVPLVELNTAEFSGRIRHGGTLAWWSDGAKGAGSRVAVVVTARWAAPPAPPPAGLAMLPISALTTTTLRQPRKGPRTTPVLPGEEPDFGFGNDVEPAYGTMEEDQLVDLLRSAAAGHSSQAGEVDAMVGGGWLFLDGDQTSVRAMQDELQRLQDAWLHDVVVTADTELLPASNGDAPFATAEANATATLLHRVTFPALMGRRHLVSRGLETTTVRDADVEIAAKAATWNPIVVPRFEGITVDVRTWPQRDGVAANLRIDLAGGPPAETPAPDAHDVMPIDRVTDDVAHFRQIGPWPASGTRELGEGPAGRWLGSPSIPQQRVTIRPLEP